MEICTIESCIDHDFSMPNRCKGMRNIYRCPQFRDKQGLDVLGVGEKDGVNSVVSPDALGRVMDQLNDTFNQELFTLKKENLEAEYWHWKWDVTRSIEYNVYNFTDLLELYRSFCVQWEVHHNGSVCVVERVRDQYLLPKIKVFINDMKLHQV